MAKPRAALGRGLDALFGADGSPGQFGLPAEAGGMIHVPIDQIVPNPYQPRQTFSDEALDTLTRSIEQHGIIQPITVRVRGDGQFELIAGERRLRAARRARLQAVPAYVRDADSEAMLEMALVENLHREDLNPIEVALGYRRLVDECGLRQADVASRVGRTRSAVTNHLRLLLLPPPIQAALRDRTIRMGHARALVGLASVQTQVDLCEETIRLGLSARQVEARVRKLNRKPPSKKRVPTRDQLQIGDYEKSLRAKFGTKVQVSHDVSGKGRVSFFYFSSDDLSRVMDLLLGSKGPGP